MSTTNDPIKQLIISNAQELNTIYNNQVSRL